MDTTFPCLATRILQWHALLEQSALTPDDQEELKIHLDDIILELESTNLNGDEIWTIAMKRIGPISVIEQEFVKVNPDIEFRKKMMLLVSGAITMLFLQLFFVLVPAYLYREYQNIPQTSDNTHFWQLLFYSLSLLLLFFIGILLFRGKSIVSYLGSFVKRWNALIAFASIATILLSGFFVIQLIEIGQIDQIGLVRSAFKILTQIFYIAQIAIIGYFILISGKTNIRNLLAFTRTINWITALLLGLGAGLLVTFGFTYHIPGLPLILGCPLYAIMGWMIGYSKKISVNLFFGQLYLMILWCSEISGNHAVIFTTYYLVILSFLIVGYLGHKIMPKGIF